MPRLVWPSTRPILTVLGVFLLHLIAASLLFRGPPTQQRQAVTRKAVNVFLLQDAGTQAKVSAPSDLQRQPDREPIRTTPTKPEPVTTALPGPALDKDSPRDAVGAVTQVEPQVPLNLNLPKAWNELNTKRHPALESGAGQRGAVTVESRMAAALGEGHWIEERMGDGRLRFRNGNKCMYAQRNRADELNPFNAPATPWLLRAQDC